MMLPPRTAALTVAIVIGIGSSTQAQAPAGSSSRGTLVWTVAAAGGGFGVGLWAGLTKFDDSINSERKVWTTAIVGAAVGAVSGYFIARSRSSRPAPAAPARTTPTLAAPGSPGHEISERTEISWWLPTPFRSAPRDSAAGLPD